MFKFREFVRTLKMSRDCTFNADGLVTVHNADFAKTPRFIEAYSAGCATGSWGTADVRWRMHVVCWAASLGMQRDGDFVECGVSKGGSARTVMEYTKLNKTSRLFYLLDTFCGPATKYMSESEKKNLQHSPQFDECLSDVRENFKIYGGTVKILPGIIPETLEQVRTKKVAYLSIDLNNTVPEIAAAEYFWPKLVSGAPVILDDYGWKQHAEQKMAFDDFAARHAVSILSLPTGQGLIIKP